ncbi:MAG: GC-type dockerin domain-anchored protein [Planctomycetota bacterium]
MVRCACLVAVLGVAHSAGAQQLDLPVLPGVPGEVDSEFSQLICYEWELGSPVMIACPTSSGPEAQALDGCLSITVDGLPATALTLRGFEGRFAPTATQTAPFIGQGSLSHTVGESVVRMVPGSGPFVGVFNADVGAFMIENVPIEAEGLIEVTGTGEAGAAFPLSTLDLSTFSFPPATVFVATLQGPGGENGFALSAILGAPLFEPGGRLDVGSGFVVGLGGGVLLNSVVGGGSCDAGEPCIADVNDDGEATSADFFAWVVAFGDQSPECDINGDSLCTSADFFAWVNAFGEGC